MRKRVLFLLLTFVFLPLGYQRAIAGEPELNRSVVSLMRPNSLEVFFQYDQFSNELDFLDYGEKVSSSTKLKEAKTYIFGAKYAYSRNFNFRYNVSLARNDVRRTIAPKRVITDFIEHDFRLQYIFMEHNKFLLAVEGGYRLHKVDPVKLFKIKTGNTTIWSLTENPVITINSDDSAWMFAIRGATGISRNMNLHLGLESRFISAEVKVDSNLFDDNVFGSKLRSEAAKFSAWKEQNILFTMGLDWAPWEKTSLAMQLTNYRIKRSGYISRANTPDYNKNIVADGYLFWHFSKNSVAYLHGKASQHYLLGELPFLYNARSQHLFKNPYGYLSIGFSTGF